MALVGVRDAILNQPEEILASLKTRVCLPRTPFVHQVKLLVIYLHYLSPRLKGTQWKCDPPQEPQKAH